MSIHRIVKDRDYSVISNVPINDTSLSWGARGLLIYLLSKPNDWTVKTSHLIKMSPAGRDATKTLLRELEQAGYLRRVRLKKDDGTFYWETHVHETIDGLSVDGPPGDGSTGDGSPVDIVSTEEPSTEEPSTTTLPAPKSEHQQMFDALSAATRMDYSIKANAGQIARMSKQLREAGYSPGDIISYYSEGGHWYSRDWRGQRGDPPTLKAIADTIGQYREAQGAPANGHLQPVPESEKRKTEELKAQRSKAWEEWSLRHDKTEHEMVRLFATGILAWRGADLVHTPGT